MSYIRPYMAHANSVSGSQKAKNVIIEKNGSQMSQILTRQNLSNDDEN